MSTKELGPSCGASRVRAVPCRQSDIRPWVVSPHRRAGFTEAPNGEEGGNLMAPSPDREALPPWIQDLYPLGRITDAYFELEGAT